MCLLLILGWSIWRYQDCIYWAYLKDFTAQTQSSCAARSLSLHLLTAASMQQYSHKAAVHVLCSRLARPYPGLASQDVYEAKMARTCTRQCHVQGMKQHECLSSLLCCRKGAVLLA